MGTLKYDGDIRWIPVRAAAAALRVSRQRVYQLIDQGAVVSMTVNGTVLVSQRSVEGRIALLLGERR